MLVGANLFPSTFVRLNLFDSTVPKLGKSTSREVICIFNDETTGPNVL